MGPTLASFCKVSQQFKIFFVLYGTNGQSYKHFTIIIYIPRVIIWSVFKSGTTRVVIYEHKLYIRLATGFNLTTSWIRVSSYYQYIFEKSLYRLSVEIGKYWLIDICYWYVGCWPVWGSMSIGDPNQSQSGEWIIKNLDKETKHRIFPKISFPGSPRIPSEHSIQIVVGDHTCSSLPKKLA